MFRARTALLVLASIVWHTPQAADYWLCRAADGVTGAQDHPCGPSQQTIAAPSSARAPAQPAPPVQAQATERAHAPLQRPAPIGNPLQPVITAVWKLVFMILTMLALVTVGRLWLRGRPGKKRRGPGNRTRGTVIGSLPRTRNARSAPGAGRESGVPRGDPASEAVVQPTEGMASLFPSQDWKRCEDTDPASGLLRVDPAPDTVVQPTEWTASLLRALEWKRFEEVCEGVWKANGYAARGTGPGSDGGVDVVIADHRNPDRVFAVAQCKAWAKPVGVEPVRALWGAKDHFGAQLAVFYSVSGFSTEASTFAAGKHLKLVSGDELLRQLLMLAESERTALLSQVTRGDFSTPSCPKCEIKMTRKAGRAGRSDFWSCPRFGSCQTRPIPVRAAAMH